jgi:uncharacterized protein (DUF2141 family)
MLNFADVRMGRAAFAFGLLSAAVFAALPAPTLATPSHVPISNDLNKCTPQSGPSILVDVAGFQGAGGAIRVQLYPATKSAWLSKGAWINRIDTPVRLANGKMRFCVPVPAAGRYGIAVRHDANGNGKTDFTKDGGGFSNNPKLSIFNMGKPAVDKAAVSVGNGPVSILINLQYL